MSLLRVSLLPASLLIALTTLAACAAPPPPAPPPKPRPAGEIDGLYRGTSTRFAAGVRNCPYPGLVTFQVMGHQFHYRLNGVLAVDATIEPTGIVSGQVGDYVLTGDWDGHKIEGDVTNEICGLHYRAEKKW